MKHYFPADIIFHDLYVLCVNILHCLPNAIIKGPAEVLFHQLLPHDVGYKYYWTFIFTYMRTWSSHTSGQVKFLVIFYTILTPTLNPIIYSFKNKDILMAVKTWTREVFCIQTEWENIWTLLFLVWCIFYNRYLIVSLERNKGFYFVNSGKK